MLVSSVKTVAAVDPVGAAAMHWQSVAPPPRSVSAMALE
jgi:hypothetical protein